MKSFCAKLSFKITNKKIGQKMAKSRGGPNDPPLPLRVTIFSLPVAGLNHIIVIYRIVESFLSLINNLCILEMLDFFRCFK